MKFSNISIFDLKGPFSNEKGPFSNDVIYFWGILPSPRSSFGLFNSR